MKTLHAATPEDCRAAIDACPRLLVAYSKDHCPGCRMLELSLRQFAAMPEAAGVALLEVKLETLGEDFFRGLGLRQTPTIALYRDGAELARLPGFQAPARIAQAAGEHFSQVPA